MNAEQIASGRWWDRAWSLVDGCTFREDRIGLPLRTCKPTVWAVSNDLFHERVSIVQIADAFNTMASWCLRCRKADCDHEDAGCWQDPGHVYLVLTTRADRMRKVMAEDLADAIGPWPGGEPLYIAMEGRETWLLPNVWVGVTVENQTRADERMPHLLALAREGWRTFVSYEPALGPVNWRKWIRPVTATGRFRTHTGIRQVQFRRRCFIGGLICGGETGPGARPMNPEWARAARDACAAAHVRFFLTHLDGTGRTLDGRTHDELPWVAEVDG